MTNGFVINSLISKSFVYHFVYNIDNK